MRVYGVLKLCHGLQRCVEESPAHAAVCHMYIPGNAVCSPRLVLPCMQHMHGETEHAGPVLRPTG